MLAQRQQPRFGALQIAIVALTFATAAIHFLLAFEPDEELTTLFFLNGLGYLALSGALYMPFFSSYQRIIRYVLIAYTALTIILWLFLGQPYDTLGYIDKAIEVLLIVLLFVEDRTQRSHNTLR